MLTFIRISEWPTWNLFESRKIMKKIFSERTSVLCILNCIGMWIANKSVQFFWKLIWDNMNILRVKSIMNRDPSARTCNRTRVLRDQQIKLVQTVSQSKFRVIFSIMKNFGKVHSFYEDSCANLVSFKIVVLSIQIKTKRNEIHSTVFLKWMDFKIGPNFVGENNYETNNVLS